MPIISNSYILDETSFQYIFYDRVCEQNVYVDRNTDGYTEGILFEHKTNVSSYGISKALSQALIYLCRFNQSGKPIPKYIMLVSQNENKAYVFKSEDYLNEIENILENSTLHPSEGIPDFRKRTDPFVIPFDLSSLLGTSEIRAFINQTPEFCKVHINKHNVYGWSIFYYNNAKKHNQKPYKKDFFDELRNPVGTLGKYIYSWEGIEEDFSLIMDLLNDPKTQKKLGAFYTPPQYAEKATELLRYAISQIPEGNDYVIIDRCAGAGSLENFLTEEELSHCILNTYELKEWIVLKERYDKLVRYIIPPVPDRNNPDILPNSSVEGLLSGANALEESFINNEIIKQYIGNPNCNIILYENPPYRNSAAANCDDDYEEEDRGAEINFVRLEMAKERDFRSALDETLNQFVWSGWNYYLKKPDDYYLLFSPVKPFKRLELCSKKFIKGFAFNKEYFHAKKDVVSCCLYKNEDENRDSITLEAYDISEDGRIIRQLKDEQPLDIKIVKTNTIMTDYYDTNQYEGDTQGTWFCGRDGLIANNTKRPTVRITNNENIIGYLRANGADLDPYSICFTRLIQYNGHGFHLRKENYYEKMPLFAAKTYTPNNWYESGIYYTVADKGNEYIEDKKFLKKCFIYSCLSAKNKCRSFRCDENTIFLNELCFDDNTIASLKLEELKQSGMLDEEELNLITGFKTILNTVKGLEEYNPEYKYGLFQIVEEIDIRIEEIRTGNRVVKVYKYGDLHNAIKEYKKKVADYYETKILPDLFKYELLK